MMNNKHHTTYHSFKKSILFLIKDSTYKEQNLSFSAICRRKNTCTDKSLEKCQKLNLQWFGINNELLDVKKEKM